MEEEMMKRLLFATVTMALISGTAYAMHGHGMGVPGAHFGQGLLRALLNLDLTDAQKHETALILSKYRDEGRERRNALRTAMEELRGTAEADPFDEGAIRAAFKAVAGTGEELAVHGAKLVAELKGVLTPEQKEYLEVHRAVLHEKQRGRVGKGVSFLDEWIETHSQEPQ
jgi:Spy/CpxP family protein refolding chaperone